MRQREPRQPAPRAPHPPAPAPLDLPAERLRAPTLDDRTVEVADSAYDLPLDERDRAREDAQPLRD